MTKIERVRILFKEMVGIRGRKFYEIQRKVVSGNFDYGAIDYTISCKCGGWS